MALFEFRVEIPASVVATVDDRLQENQALAWTIIEDVDTRRAWLVGIFGDQAAGEDSWRALGVLFGDLEVSTGPMEVRRMADADWKDSYKAHFKSWNFGALHWVPEWERASYRAGATDKVLWLDPGMAFGTGNHETTRLCCERLVEFVQRRGAAGCSLIDAGCGSGILALSAAKLGFPSVVGFDNDPVAIDVSRENASRNGLLRAVDFFVADLPAGLAGRQADLVLANIQADVLEAFADRLVRAVARGGELVLSGILRRELAMVQARFRTEARDWDQSSRELGDWADLRLLRPVEMT